MTPDPLLVGVILVMVLGILGTVLPVLPGALLSLASVFLYAWLHGFTTPSPLALTVIALLGTTALLIDYFGGAIAARAGGASTRSAVLGGLVGIVMLFVAGPLGLLVGLCTAVFLLEYYSHRSVRRGVRSSLIAVLGIMASTAMQVVLTSCMLLVFIVSV